MKSTKEPTNDEANLGTDYQSFLAKLKYPIEMTPVTPVFPLQLPPQAPPIRLNVLPDVGLDDASGPFFNRNVIKFEDSEQVNHIPAIATVTTKLTTSKDEYPCKECDYKSERPSGLQRHVDTVHKKLRYSCSQCGKEVLNLQHHIKTVHVKEQMYSCNLCSYMTSRKEILTRHVKTVHTGIRKTCLECGKEVSNLLQHVRSVHEKKLQFFCDECGYRSCRKDTLKRHKKFVHSKMIGDFPDADPNVTLGNDVGVDLMVHAAAASK